MEMSRLIENELVYGLLHGRIVSIKDVDRGLDCGCTCPHCGSRLVAKKGEVNRHHFAHHDDENCAGGPETAIHMLAKQIISDEKILSVLNLEVHQGSRGKDLLISSSLIALESVFVEQTSDNYRPDITAITEVGESLEIEIFVTHTVGELKQIEARDRGQKMIEIDLSDLPYDSEFETVRNRVLYSAPRKWISHPEIESILSTLTPMETEDPLPKESLLSNMLGVYSTNCFSDNQDRLVFGFKSGKGFSPKYNSNFELSKLYVAKPVQRSSTRNFSIDASSGYEFEEIEFDEICLDNLKLLTFPCVLNLRIGSRIRGRMSIPVVMGLQQIKI